MMTIKDIKKMYQGQYSEIEVYSGDSFHTDSCQPVDDYKDNFVVKKWQLMDEEDYNSTILANCGIRFEEIHEKIDKILCLLITGDREVIAIRNIPYNYDTTDEMTDFHIFVADDMDDQVMKAIRRRKFSRSYGLLSTQGYTELLTAGVDLDREKTVTNPMGQDLAKFFGKLFALRHEEAQSK